MKKLFLKLIGNISVKIGDSIKDTVPFINICIETNLMQPHIQWKSILEISIKDNSIRQACQT